jgi:class 3 adenylate cyclase
MAAMAKLTTAERAKLPDSAFAYVDAAGKRRLPIHDAAHVRNALARFDQVVFEDEAARDRARTRLLRAAHKHGVAPIGFVRAEIQPQRRFPKGNVTFLLTDMEASTSLLARLGESYGPLLTKVRGLVRAAVRQAGGQEVDARGDEMLAVFREPAAALKAALAIQHAMQESSWPGAGADVRLRVGLHSGRPTLTETGYVGLAVHTTARVCFAAHGGQILITSAVRSGLANEDVHGLSLKRLGNWHFRGLPKPVKLFQVDAVRGAQAYPPPRGAKRTTLDRAQRR